MSVGAFAAALAADAVAEPRVSCPRLDEAIQIPIQIPMPTAMNRNTVNATAMCRDTPEEDEWGELINGRTSNIQHPTPNIQLSGAELHVWQ